MLLNICCYLCFECLTRWSACQSNRWRSNLWQLLFRGALLLKGVGWGVSCGGRRRASFLLLLLVFLWDLHRVLHDGAPVAPDASSCQRAQAPHGTSAKAAAAAAAATAWAGAAKCGLAATPICRQTGREGKFGWRRVTRTSGGNGKWKLNVWFF